MTADLRDSRDLEKLKVLGSHSRRGLSSNYIVQLLDSFSHEGPNGVHQCLVFELLGPSVDRILADYREGHDKLCPETVLQMSTQLLKALKFIHSAGMSHGDISGRNMAFSCTNLSHASENELFEVLGTPEIELLARVDGAPLHNGLPTQLVKAAEWVENITGTRDIFTDSFDYRVDLWRAGCMIYSFVFTTYPFWYLGEGEVLVFQMDWPCGESTGRVELNADEI
ncbi:hypothetical protein AFLA_013121 [Aspergillus flavus NRRL3357]|nr:hypothetical protein AFLA_013121 [Aspergillus flavus NRRL3357]